MAARVVSPAFSGGGLRGRRVEPRGHQLPRRREEAPARLVALDAGNFEPLVLSVSRPSLVKFQSPT